MIMTSYMNVWKGTAERLMISPDSCSISSQTFSYITSSMRSKILVGTIAILKSFINDLFFLALSLRVFLIAVMIGFFIKSSCYLIMRGFLEPSAPAKPVLILDLILSRF